MNTLARTFVSVLALALAAGPACTTRSEKTVTVFAAASLTDAFKAIAADFEKANPGVDLKLSFAGSQSLRTQIEHGAHANVFASANVRHMEALRSDGLVENPTVFANNQMVIVVPRNNPAGIERFADLVRAKRLVLAGPSVPAGRYAERVLRRAATDPKLGADFADRVLDRVVSREMHVRATLQKVVLGEADAAIVYATDGVAVGEGVKSIAIPEAYNIQAAYPIALVGKQTDLSRKFVDFVRSPAGRKHLEAHGFIPASGKVATTVR
jgi:molybdate transport system substrate-binding protein